jgi:probable F420-dependent oxidoreductase
MDIGFLMAATAECGDLAEIARNLESHGYESLWIAEHPVIPIGMKTPFPFTPDHKLPDHYARWADPFIALTMAAAVTKKLRLGTGVCLLPERETLVTAKVAASLDLFSGGRLLLGVGAGWLREETEAMGARFGTRWKRTREAVEAMRILWTRREPSYEGETVKFPAVRSEPKPIQKMGPPVLLGAHGPKALERVARTYDGWMPLVASADELKASVTELRKIAAAQGRDPGAIQISPLVDPGEHGLSTDEVKRYREAGATRLILASQKSVAEAADGKTTEIVRRYAAAVDRARSL